MSACKSNPVKRIIASLKAMADIFTIRQGMYCMVLQGRSYTFVSIKTKTMVVLT